MSHGAHDLQNKMTRAMIFARACAFLFVTDWTELNHEMN